mmetsp:Transcript_13610/g.34454  ORF Transcript_13610/g.34454 Transcript_13610/m.34454 type:complete len:120 (-) Transcript_13610:1304-1663(-)
MVSSARSAATSVVTASSPDAVDLPETTFEELASDWGATDVDGAGKALLLHPTFVGAGPPATGTGGKATIEPVELSSLAPSKVIVKPSDAAAAPAAAFAVLMCSGVGVQGCSPYLRQTWA